MENSTKKSWLDGKFWLVIAAIGLLALIGLALPLVRPHTVSYDPEAWEFIEDSRVDIGIGSMFGLEGAVLWPYLVIYGLILVAALLPIAGHFLKKESAMFGASMFVFIFCAVALFVSSFFYGYINALASIEPYREDLGEYYSWYIQSYVNIADARLGVGTLLSASLCVIGAVVSFSASMEENRMSVRDLTEIAMLCASAIVLDVVFHFIPNIPGQVGSVSVALVPLYFLALRHGPARGFLAASIIYGLLTCMTDGYGLYLYPLDYFVGYSGVAVIGFFRSFILGNGQKTYSVKAIIFIVLGVLIGSVVRLVGSGLSSIVNYGYTLSAAIVCNLYIFISGGASIVVILALYKPFLQINQRFPVRQMGAKVAN